MAATLADLDAAIAAENAKLTSLETLATQLVADVAALAAKVNEGQDFTAELQALQANSALLDSTVSSVTSADATAKG